MQNTSLFVLFFDLPNIETLLIQFADKVVQRQNAFGEHEQLIVIIVDRADGAVHHILQHFGRNQASAEARRLTERRFPVRKVVIEAPFRQFVIDLRRGNRAFDARFLGKIERQKGQEPYQLTLFVDEDDKIHG